LPTCAVCQAALREAQDALARAMLSTPPQAPPAAAREALVRRVGRARGADRRSWLRWAAATAVVAEAAAGFTGTWVAVRYEARLGQMARETAAVKERLARNEASLGATAALYRATVELLPGQPPHRAGIHRRRRPGLRRHRRARGRGAGADRTDRSRLEMTSRRHFVTPVTATAPAAGVLSQHGVARHLVC